MLKSNHQSFIHMKKTLLLTVSLTVLLGFGCSQSDSSNATRPIPAVPTNRPEATYTQPAVVYQPVPAIATNPPGQEAQTSYVQLVYAVDANSCDGFKNFFSAALKAGLSQTDCDAAFAYMKSTYIPIDWDNGLLSSGNILTIKRTDGSPFASWVLENGAWMLNTKFWEVK